MKDIQSKSSFATKSSGLLLAAAFSAVILWSGEAFADDDKKVAPAAATAPDKKPAGEAKKKSEGTIDKVMDRARLLMQKLEKRSRSVDPFGMSMNAEEEVVHEEEAVEDAPRQVTTLEEAVARFRVSGVVPKRKEVIVGARSLGIGDRILIEHREVRFELSIVEITAKSIALKDAETGEIASVDLGIVPEDLPADVAGRGPQSPSLGIESMNSAYQVE